VNARRVRLASALIALDLPALDRRERDFAVRAAATGHAGGTDDELRPQERQGLLGGLHIRAFGRRGRLRYNVAFVHDGAAPGATTRPRLPNRGALPMKSLLLLA